MSEQNTVYDVVGIGNAIVDVLAKVGDTFLKERDLTKGCMTLVEAAETGQDIKGRSRELEKKASPTKYQVLTDRVVYIQTQIIKKLADRGPCVFVGRCADYVLKDRDNVLNVFVYAPYEVRLKKVIDTLNISKEAAEYRVKTQGEQLHARYKQMTGTYRGDRHNRHLLIDSSVLGIEDTALFIEDFANRVLEKRD